MYLWLASNSTLLSTGGGDTPEAIADALNEITDLNWNEAQRPHAVRMAVLIGDAPPHGMFGLTCRDKFPNGCPNNHDWLILAEQCRSRKINIFIVLLRNDDIAARAFSAIANSSGGKCIKLSESGQSEVINLSKLHVYDQLDRQLTSSKVSYVIIKTPLPGLKLEQSLVRVKEELFRQGFTVQRLEIKEGVATIEIKPVSDSDMHEAVEDWKSCERHAATKRDADIMDHMGKKLYALRKVQGSLPAAVAVSAVETD